ncbi:MAG: GHKL domain-containing protein [Clostridia bacterium]|nr:GHKL domain-containing protein [Clostridia bacterium]
MRIAFELAATLFDSWLAVWFVKKFCKFEDKLSWRIGTIFLLVAVTEFSNEYMAQFSVGATLILALITLLYTAVSAYKIDFRQVLATCLFWISLVVVSSLLFVILSIITKDFENLIMGSNALVRYLYVILHKIVLTAVLWLIVMFVSIEGKISKLNSALTFLILTVSVIGLGATMYIVITEASIQFGVQLTVIILAFLGTNVILYVMLSQISRLQKVEYEHKILEEKSAFDSTRYEETNAIWHNVRTIQHDMKHHLSVIQAQLDSGNVEESREYLTKLLPEIESMGRVIRSDNKTIDYIINSKLGALKDTQIVISGLIADFSDIEDRDLACLFGNLLDNAIEAIADLEEKRIEIIFSIENSSRMIIFKNTIGASVLKTNPNLRSTKKDGSSHGYGHKIVEKIVKDNRGMIDYFEEGDMFGVQIILPGISK